MSGARPGTKSQLNESVDIRRPGAPENRIEVAIQSACRTVAPENCTRPSCCKRRDSGAPPVKRRDDAGVSLPRWT